MSFFTIKFDSFLFHPYLKKKNGTKSFFKKKWKTKRKKINKDNLTKITSYFFICLKKFIDR